MKTTLDTYGIANALIEDSNANWSRAGAFALAEYLEEYEESTGEELELDVVAIRCDFSEYESFADWRSGYFTNEAQAQEAIGYDDEADDDDKDEATREYIMDHGQLVEFDGGIIVSSF